MQKLWIMMIKLKLWMQILNWLTDMNWYINALPDKPVSNLKIAFSFLDLWNIAYESSYFIF